MNYLNYFYLVIILLFISLQCFAQEERKEVVSFEDAYKRRYPVGLLSVEKPKIDGKLDDSIWVNKGDWSEKFSQVIPFERVFTPSWTRMKIFYDQDNIYVGVYCKDAHPETMNAFIGNRDDNSNGDLISIAFDTYGDYRAAVEFNINLGGNKTDLTVTDKLSVNLSWNAVWEGKTAINPKDSSWTAELRIPFSQLRYNRDNPSEKWGLHVRRIIRRNNEVQNWSLIPIKNNGHVFSFGEMTGMRDLPKPRGIEFAPYVMSKLKMEPKIPNSPFQKGTQWTKSVGLDGKLAVHDYTLDLTINPDYGQVELDPSVMNLSAYEVFYDEKRPFFLEGKHILEFDNNANGLLFYSRRIGAMPSYLPQEIEQVNSFSSTARNVPILGAMKLTGTNRNGVTIGILESVTAQTIASISRENNLSEQVTEPLTNYSVGRIQKNWDGNMLLGGMITSVNRRLDQTYLQDNFINNAFTAGIDFTKYFSNRLYYIDAKGMVSTLHGEADAIAKRTQNATHYYQRESGQSYLPQDIQRENLQGTGGYIKVGKKGNAQWNFSESFSWATPGFDINDIGYLKESDYKTNETEITFRKTDPWGPFRFAGINLIQRNTWNFGGKAVSNDVSLRWRSFSIKKRFEMDIKETFVWNSIDTRRLRGGPDLRYNSSLETAVVLNTDRAKPVMFKLEYYGKQYLGKQHTGYNSWHPSAIFRLGNHTRLTGQFNFGHNQDAVQYVATVPRLDAYSASDQNYIMGHMKQQTYGVTLNMQYNLTPDLSIQYYCSPFTSIAKFDEFKLAKNTLSSQFDSRFLVLGANDLTFSDGNYVFQNQNNTVKFANPDFSFNELRSILVTRWEYLPGSSLYFVWEHNRSNRTGIYYSGWGNNLDHMSHLPAANTLMIKANYWFSL